jgi:hypothetical protein
LSFPLSPYLAYQVPFYGRLVFCHLSCGVAGLRGTFPGYPRPPSLFSFYWTTQHEYNNTQHPWEAHPAWDSNPADLAVVSEECRSSTTLPSAPDRHTHTSMARRRFLPSKNLPPSVGFEPTSAGTATSEHCLRQPCGHRATSVMLLFFFYYNSVRKRFREDDH